MTEFSDPDLLQNVRDETTKVSTEKKGKEKLKKINRKNAEKSIYICKKKRGKRRFFELPNTSNGRYRQPKIVS